MALTKYTLSDADIGAALAPTDGFLTELWLDKPKANVSYAPPAWDEGRMIWRSGYLQIRGELDFKDLVCVCPSQGGVSSWSGTMGQVVIGASLPYRGALRILCCPKGSVWQMTLSDIAIDKTLLATPQSYMEFSQQLREKVLAEQAAIWR